MPQGGARWGAELESELIIFEGMDRLCFGLIFYKWYFLLHSFTKYHMFGGNIMGCTT